MCDEVDNASVRRLPHPIEILKLKLQLIRKDIFNVLVHFLVYLKAREMSEYFLVVFEHLVGAIGRRNIRTFILFHKPAQLLLQSFACGDGLI